MYEYNLGIRFERIAEEHWNRIAIRFNGAADCSYRELNELANQFARLLVDEGVAPGSVVAISGAKKLLTFACMIGCLKMGAIYTILDSENPVDRLAKILSNCGPRALVVESDPSGSLLQSAAQTGTAIICHGDKKLHARIRAFDSSNLPETRLVTGESPAYIMHTSGSTGFPKGAIMSHANVLNFIRWSTSAFSIGPEDVLTNVNPLYFDNSVFDFYSSLFSGASMLALGKEIVTDPKSLISSIDEVPCTIWFSVPSMLVYLQTMKALERSNMRFIRLFVFGGEGFPKPKLKQLFDMYGDRSELVNVYGPTECTCICSAYRIGEDDFEDLRGVPALGQLAENFGYMILNAQDEAAAVDEIGELCLLGPNVGKGYYNDAETTARSFVENSFNTKFKEIMYRTGDLVRLSGDDGKIYIVGRKDSQIKHMGYRVELEEIETALHCLEYVLEAAVVHGSVRGLSRIVGIIASKQAVEEPRLREDLRKIIPHYMIPSRFHFVERLPRNANGKIDRKALFSEHLREDSDQQSKKSVNESCPEESPI